MSLYAIADLHLSLGADKLMDIFGGWDNYVTRLEENWRRTVKADDTVVIAGDISWAMRLEQSFNDFAFIESLPGKKILLKGNHDYWWTTRKKIEDFFQKNNFNSMSILFNSAEIVENFAVCGTRGWSYDCSTQEDIKILNREVGRLTTSIEQAKQTDKEIIEEWATDAGVNVHLTIDREQEGWTGHVGFVPNYVKELGFTTDKTAILCGPPIMIKFTLAGLIELGFDKSQVYTTLEMRMKCGIGKCGRCNVASKFICKDGPVFRFDELDELPDEY